MISRMSLRESILGQDEALRVLNDALTAGRVHHAWIFSGPQGVGKFTTAVEAGRILLDPAPRRTADGWMESDPQGRASRLVDAGNHPDLHLVYKELAQYSSNPQLRERKLLNIPLDLLRERMLGGRTGDDRVHEAPAYRTPVESRSKVFIIDEAELIDATGQNALLKTLEEPPAGTYFFLVTSHPDLLLPTILSRAQHLRFRPLPPEALAEWFGRADLDAGDDERRWLMRFCEGSPGLALLAARYGLYRWEQTLAPLLRDLDAGRFPLELGETLAGLADGFATAWVKQNANASKDAANRDGAGHVLRLLASRARDRLAAACRDGSDTAPWLDAIDALRAAEEQLEANVNLKHVMEGLAAGG